jgi:hypothetical protein
MMAVKFRQIVDDVAARLPRPTSRRWLAIADGLEQTVVACCGQVEFTSRAERLAGLAVSKSRSRARCGARPQPEARAAAAGKK